MDINITCACGHHFSLTSRPGSEIRCPACDRKIPLPEGDITGAGVIQDHFRLKCKCGHTAQFDERPSEDFICPGCGAPLGKHLAELRNDPSLGTHMSMKRSVKRPIESHITIPREGVRFGLGTVIFLILAAAAVTLVVVKVLMGRP